MNELSYKVAQLTDLIRNARVVFKRNDAMLVADLERNGRCWRGAYRELFAQRGPLKSLNRLSDAYILAAYDILLGYKSVKGKIYSFFSMIYSCI